MQETQFLATALQKPLASKRATPPPLLSVYSSAPSVTPVSNTASLPSIDLSLAISNFTSSASGSGSSHHHPSDANLKRRKLTDGIPDGYLKTEVSDDRKTEPMAIVDMTPPNSIANDDTNESNLQRQDPLQDRAVLPRTDPTPRPYQSQCRGEYLNENFSHFRRSLNDFFLTFGWRIGERPRNARVPFCPHCGEDCHNISVLRYHVKTTHSEPSGCLCCCFCTAVFNLHSSAEYKQHTLDTHGVKYTWFHPMRMRNCGGLYSLNRSGIRLPSEIEFHLSDILE